MSSVLTTTSAGVPYAASGATLAKATGAAAVVAAVALVFFVLPAEYGIDPTGVGARLGLAQMGRGEEAAAAAPAPASAVAGAAAPAVPVEPQTQASISKATPLRNDEMTVVMKPHSGLEIKAEMKTGDHFIFNWASSAPLKMDMHGEKPNDGDKFTRYWMQSDMSGAQGAFTAPFDGHHGWFWRNRSDQEVTVKIRTSGFYEKLYIPR